MSAASNNTADTASAPKAPANISTRKPPPLVAPDFLFEEIKKRLAAGGVKLRIAVQSPHPAT